MPMMPRNDDLAKLSAEALVDRLIQESGRNNEYDNWDNVERVRREVLRRLLSR